MTKETKAKLDKFLNPIMFLSCAALIYSIFVPNPYTIGGGFIGVVSMLYADIKLNYPWEPDL